MFKIRAAESADGLTWLRHGVALIDDVLEEDECQASPDVIFYQGLYHMFFSYKYSSDFRNSSRGYRIGYASSSDLVTWRREDSKAGIDVSPGVSWDDQSIAYPHVFELDGNVYMLYLGNAVGRSDSASRCSITPARSQRGTTENEMDQARSDIRPHQGHASKAGLTTPRRPKSSNSATSHGCTSRRDQLTTLANLESRGVRGLR